MLVGYNFPLFKCTKNGKPTILVITIWNAKIDFNCKLPRWQSKMPITALIPNPGKSCFTEIGESQND